MGNKLTVANATDGVINIYASVIEFEVKKLSAGFGTKPSADVELADDEVKIGWVAVAPYKAWTFPKLVCNRYFLTVTRKGHDELIANTLQIPWHTNVIVKPDNTLTYAKSGTVWFDSDDLVNYRSKKSVDSRPETLAGYLDVVDGDLDSTDSDVRGQSLQTVTAFLKQHFNIPEYIADLFVNKCCDLGEFDSDSIQHAAEVFFKLLAGELSHYAARGRHPDISVLAEILKQDVFNILNADDVIRELMYREAETIQCLRELTAIEEVEANQMS